MVRKTFYSILFEKEIKDSDKNYSAYVKAEVLYRIKDMEEKNCSCFQCKSDLKKLITFYDKIFSSKKEAS